jgi:hypothetical protein
MPFGQEPTFCEKSRLSLYIGEILGARQFMHGDTTTCEHRQQTTFSENLGKVSSETRNMGKSLSSCHLKKQRLINSLEAEVHEKRL